MKKCGLIAIGGLLVALAVSGGELPLPGEPCSKAPVSCAPFPDRMSAYVWRNWFVVPHARLAAAVGATEADLESDVAGMRQQVERELASAKELLDLARQDSRFGYESSNQYFYIPQDLREKIVACRMFLDGE